MSRTESNRSDPIGDKYFRPLELADNWSDRLFYITAIASFAALLVDRKQNALLYDAVQGTFVALVIGGFILGLVVRLYWRPRAEDRRRTELLSNSFDLSLTHERTAGYYNNDETEPVRRLGAAVLENSLFSKTIALRMTKGERIKVAVYAAMFVGLILYRGTDLSLAAAGAQAIFSEQIISRWLRLEWLRIRFDTTYEQLFSLFQASGTKTHLHAKVIELLAYYETSKANAGITLSSKVFLRINPEVSAEWDDIKRTLKL